MPNLIRAITSLCGTETSMLPAGAYTQVLACGCCSGSCPAYILGEEIYIEDVVFTTMQHLLNKHNGRMKTLQTATWVQEQTWVMFIRRQYMWLCQGPMHIVWIPSCCCVANHIITLLMNKTYALAIFHWLRSFWQYTCQCFMCATIFWIHSLNGNLRQQPQSRWQHVLHKASNAALIHDLRCKFSKTRFVWLGKHS